MYFIVGGKGDGAKFQLGFKYRFFNPRGPMASRWTWLDDLYIAYTQSSIWDIYEESSPFRDTNYKPELIYHKQGLKENWGWISRFDMQGGFRHESNGQDGSDSRSINYIYAKPIFHFGDLEKVHLTVIPRAWFYVGDDSDNPDIEKFRGYVDLELNIGKPDGVELKSYYRMGTAGKGAVQLDLSYPLREFLFRNLDFYLYGQFFHGYGESLLSYDRKDTTVRAGLGLARRAGAALAGGPGAAGGGARMVPVHFSILGECRRDLRGGWLTRDDLASRRCRDARAPLEETDGRRRHVAVEADPARSRYEEVLPVFVVQDGAVAHGSRFEVLERLSGQSRASLPRILRIRQEHRGPRPDRTPHRGRRGTGGDRICLHGLWAV